MKVHLGPTDVRISWEDENEKRYVKSIIEKLSFAFENTEFDVWYDGIHIKGRRVNNA